MLIFPFLLLQQKKGKNQMREAFGGYQGVRKVLIYFISCSKASLCATLVLGLCLSSTGSVAFPGARSVPQAAEAAGHHLYALELLKIQARSG